MSGKLKQLIEQYHDELYCSVMPFWLKNSIDNEFGGFYTCLDRKGNVFDTDKFIWLQGREVWLLAMLYNNVEKNTEWLNAAISGAEFLKKHGHDGNYNWYFSTDRKGNPLVEPYNIFSNTFACMAFGQLAKATGSKEYEEIALATWNRILERRDNPKGKWNKLHPGTRPLKNFALPMILCNLVLEIEHLLPEGMLSETAESFLNEVINEFMRPELGGIVLENVAADGSIVDCFEGRHLNPGHAIEAMWFIMDLGIRMSRPELVDLAKNTALTMAEYGWDKEFGGIYYFMDLKGAPPQELEWDQKLWWVHIEALISMAKGYALTGDPRCLAWFKRLHDYTWSHFRDTENPEWFGYLNRRGEVLLELKGGKWKGCFHVPRGLYQVHKTLEYIAEKRPDLAAAFDTVFSATAAHTADNNAGFLFLTPEPAEIEKD